MFFNSFVLIILEINGIVSKEEDMVEALKILDEYRVSMTMYYRDTNNVCY